MLGLHCDRLTVSTEKLPIARFPDSPFARPDHARQHRQRALIRLAAWVVFLTWAFFLLIPSVPSLNPFATSDMHVSPLDPAFVENCHDLLVAPKGTFTSRLTRLTHALSLLDTSDTSGSVQARQAGWIAEPGPSAEYFLGAFGKKDWWLSERPFLIAVTPSTGEKGEADITLLSPKFEQLRAQGISVPEELEGRVTFVAWQESDSPYEVLIEHLKGKADAFLVDGQVRSFISAGLRNAAKGAVFEAAHVDLESEGGVSSMLPVQEAVALIRQRKDKREVDLMRCANQFTLHAIRKTRAQMYIGISESKTATILRKEMSIVSKKGGSFDGGLILFGADAALPHGSGTNKKLKLDEFALIDAGITWGGYFADITRTFALPGSKIPKSHLEIWETVRHAQYVPYEFLKSSNASAPPKLSLLDVAARDVVTTSMAALLDQSTDSAVRPDFSVFTHRLGHGIGLEGHEGPYLVQGPLGETRALSGHTFSLEPGIYLPAGGEGRHGISGVGARLEDCFVVTEDVDGMLGGEWLTGPVKEWGDI